MLKIYTQESEIEMTSTRGIYCRGFTKCYALNIVLNVKFFVQLPLTDIVNFF